MGPMMNRSISYLVTFILFLNGSLSAGEKILSLSNETRNLHFPDVTLSDLYFCKIDQKRVFGKNSPLNQECYSVKSDSIERLLGYSLQNQESNIESQYAFFSADGRQVFPYWEENSKSFTMISFVLRENQNCYVQVLQKDTKKYFFWKSRSSDWQVGRTLGDKQSE